MSLHGIHFFSFNQASPQLVFGDALWLCLSVNLSNMTAYLYTVPLCLAESWVLSQDYVKCQNPVWCWNASSALQRCELSSWSLFAADNKAQEHVHYISHPDLHSGWTVTFLCMCVCVHFNSFPHFTLNKVLITCAFLDVNQMRHCVLPYWILSSRGPSVRTLRKRLYLLGLVVTFGLAVLKN